MTTDPDLAKVGAALQRAAANARQLGLATKTPVYVYRDGNIVDIVAEHPTTRLPKNATAKNSQKKKRLHVLEKLNLKRPDKPTMKATTSGQPRSSFSA